MYFCPAMGGFFACRPFLWNVLAHELFSCGRKQTVASLIRQLLYFSPAFPASKVVDFVHLILQAFCGILYIDSFLHTDSTCSVFLLDGGRNMFAVGDNVLYGADGVCTITEHGMRDFFGSTREYYIFSAIACCV